MIGQQNAGLGGTIFVGQSRIPCLAGTKHLATGLSLLPPHIHPEITRFHHMEDRLASLTARLLVRKVMRVHGFTAESTLEHWQKDVHGRPLLKGSGVDISISHAYPLVVCAVGVACRIGIDVEKIRSVDIWALAPFLMPHEWERINSATHPQEEALLCWSRREAILKADGRGLLAPDEIIRDINAIRTPAGQPWQVMPLECTGGCLFLAMEQGTTHISRVEWAFSELFMH